MRNTDRPPGWLRDRRVLLAGLVTALVSVPLPVLAHAILLDSTPASGAAIPAGSLDVELRFNSRIDRARSVVKLVRPDRVESVLSIVPTGAPQLILTHVEVSPGRYTLRWQVLAVDGHITRGDVPFTVKQP